MTLEEKNKLLQANYEKLVLQYNILDRNYKDLCKTQEALAQPAQEPVAWMRSALDNARDVCKYLDHDMIKEAKAHTKFFWNDIEKIKEPDTHTAPSWRGLSDDEFNLIMDEWSRDGNPHVAWGGAWSADGEYI